MEALKEILLPFSGLLTDLAVSLAHRGIYRSVTEQRRRRKRQTGKQSNKRSQWRGHLTSGSSRVQQLAWRHLVPAVRRSGSLTFRLLLARGKKKCLIAIALDCKNTHFLSLDCEDWGSGNHLPLMILVQCCDIFQTEKTIIILQTTVHEVETVSLNYSIYTQLLGCLCQILNQGVIKFFEQSIKLLLFGPSQDFFFFIT